MNENIAIAVAVVAALVVLFFIAKRKKDKGRINSTMGRGVGTVPKPAPIPPPYVPPKSPPPKVPDPKPGTEFPKNPPKLPPVPSPGTEFPKDRNGLSKGDKGYDPRASRPADEFSPPEPKGSYYGEGPFIPTSRWVEEGGIVHNP